MHGQEKGSDRGKKHSSWYEIKCAREVELEQSHVRVVRVCMEEAASSCYRSSAVVTCSSTIEWFFYEAGALVGDGLDHCSDKLDEKSLRLESEIQANQSQKICRESLAQDRDFPML